VIRSEQFDRYVADKGNPADDCCTMAVGIATEVGIEPTARHAADLGLIPVIIADACGTGDAQAAERSLQSLAFSGDSLITDTQAFCELLVPRRSQN
jgi:nicotinamidase-related amidase